MPLNVDVVYVQAHPIKSESVKSHNLGWMLYNWLVKHEARSIIGRPRLLLIVSSWMAKCMKEACGLHSKVLYPPVDVDFYAYNGGGKEVHCHDV